MLVVPVASAGDLDSERLALPCGLVGLAAATDAHAGSPRPARTRGPLAAVSCAYASWPGGALGRPAAIHLHSGASSTFELGRRRAGTLR